jgi:hypothetical protein
MAVKCLTLMKDLISFVSRARVTVLRTVDEHFE